MGEAADTIAGTLGAGGLPITAALVTDEPRPRIPRECSYGRGALHQARNLLADVYRFGPHPSETLPRDPSWREDPQHDANWQVWLHSQWYVLALLETWTRTGDERYARRARFLVRDWIRDNPRASAAPYAWYDQATGVRASVFACVWRVLGPSRYLRRAIALHGALLADPAFYVYTGNHALGQDLGLLDAGFVLHRQDWMRLARDRMASLVVRSVSRRGVTNEQAVGYQQFNFSLYRLAESHLRAYGLRVPDGFERIGRMPGFLAHATLPNGDYVMIGDTSRERALAIPGTVAEFASTGGTAGPMPRSTMALYRREGFLFARTGWGTCRAFTDEAAFSLHFGPSRIHHGHLDGGSVTLYGYGERLVLDPGKFIYGQSPFRHYFTGRTAHNVVVVDGVSFQAVATPLRRHRSTARHTDTTVSTLGYPGVTAQRRVIFSRRLGYLLVEDRLTSGRPHRYRQLWHLDRAAAAAVEGDEVRTTRPRGNLLIKNLTGGWVKVVRGRTDPIQGWLADRYGVRVPVPVVQVMKRGKNVRYLTLLVPSALARDAEVVELAGPPDGIRLQVTVGDRSEVVTMTKRGSRVEDGPATDIPGGAPPSPVPDHPDRSDSTGTPGPSGAAASALPAAEATIRPSGSPSGVVLDGADPMQGHDGWPARSPATQATAPAPESIPPGQATRACGGEPGGTGREGEGGEAAGEVPAVALAHLQDSVLLEETQRFTKRGP